MLDHLPECLEQAKVNIRKSNPALLKGERIIEVLQDGKEGLEAFGPYDVIHFGAAIEHLTPKILG